MNFGDKVSQLRKQRRMTQRQLADEIGVSLRTITNYETGGRYPKQREIYQKIAQALQVDVNYLLTENESFIVYAHEQYGSKGMQQAQRILAEIRGLFSGGELAEEDKDEMMRAIQDAYWIAKERTQEREAALAAAAATSAAVQEAAQSAPVEDPSLSVAPEEDEGLDLTEYLDSLKIDDDDSY